MNATLSPVEALQSAPEFTVFCDEPHDGLGYWTARLIGTDPKELNLAVTGPSKRAAIFAVLDMYVCARGNHD